jgi:hypothetical protein
MGLLLSFSVLGSILEKQCETDRHTDERTFACTDRCFPQTELKDCIRSAQLLVSRISDIESPRLTFVHPSSNPPLTSAGAGHLLTALGLLQPSH